MMFQSELQGVDTMGNVAQTLPDLFNGEILFNSNDEIVLDVGPNINMDKIVSPNLLTGEQQEWRVKSEHELNLDNLMDYVVDDSSLNFPLPSPSSNSSSSDESVENTTNLIAEMEDFINQYESNPQMFDSEQIVDVLVKENCSSPPLVDNSNAVFNHLNNVVTANHNISNISQIVTETGEKVIIVVAKEDSSSSDVSSDSDWSPSGLDSNLEKTSKSSSRRGSKPGYKRGPYKRSSHSNITDRKERKKKQNVEAARRYRDKKKNEQSGIEIEEEKVLKRNQELKLKLQETQSELKTLRKLMVELGLVKVRGNDPSQLV